MELTADYSTPPEDIAKAMSEDWLNVIGVFYGLGDGGLGPRWVEVMTQDALAKKGYTKFSGGHAMFQDIEKCADRLPTWDEEMYLEYHRGVLTTQSWIKRAHRNSEMKMKTAESLRSMLQAFGAAYPAKSFLKTWKLILLQHFHDILPGSSIPEVHEDAKIYYAEIDTAISEFTQAGMTYLAKMTKTNPH